MFEPFGQFVQTSEAAPAVQRAGSRLARAGIWLFWILLAVIVVARAVLATSGNLFAFAN